MKKYIVIGIIILFVGASGISTISGNIINETSKNYTLLQNKDFWSHEDVDHFVISSSLTLTVPEGPRLGPAYNYGSFSIIPSRDTGYDPWVVWIDDSTGNSNALKFEDVASSNHAGMSLQIDSEGYIWITHGGYADVVPFDLYKSNTPLSTSDYTGYTKKLNDYWTIIGACSPSILILDDKVNLFFRNWWNDDPGTEIQQLQYDINDFSTPLINREIVKGALFEGYPIVPCYTWGKIDPRYNMGFLSFVWKQSLPSPLWGSYPFIGFTDGGDTLVEGDGSSCSIPIYYTSADIPLDNIRDNVRSATSKVNLGVTPNGNAYHLPHWTDYDVPRKTYGSLFINDGGGWDEVWQRIYWSPMAPACGPTKDYLVLLCGDENKIDVSVSLDNGVTWSSRTTIIELDESERVSGISIAQPALVYTDNILRFFYGKTNADNWSLTEGYYFVKFDAADFAFPLNSAPDKPDTPSGATYGKPGVEYSISTSTVDQDGDEIYYKVDWGDGAIDEEVGPFESGELAILSHTWDDIGDYEIKVNALDNYFAESGWSDPFTVQVIDPDIEIGPVIGGLFNVKVVIENNGRGSAYEVNWSIDVFGGFIFSGKETTGTIDVLPEDDEVEVRSDLIFGIGTVVLKIEAEMPGISSDSKEQNAIVFLIFILTR